MVQGENYGLVRNKLKKRSQETWFPHLAAFGKPTGANVPVAMVAKENLPEANTRNFEFPAGL